MTSARAHHPKVYLGCDDDGQPGLFPFGGKSLDMCWPLSPALYDRLVALPPQDAHRIVDTMGFDLIDPTPTVTSTPKPSFDLLSAPVNVPLIVFPRNIF